MMQSPTLIINRRPSEEFIRALEAARVAALGGNDQLSLHIRQNLPQEDDAVRYMAQHIPIFAQYRPTDEQARAGGCARCIYLGLWADRWPDYEPSLHGNIWVFEQGLRGQGGDLYRQVYATLLHEMDHALQRDHVLDAMATRLNAASAQRAAALAYHPAPRPCCGQ